MRRFTLAVSTSLVFGLGLAACNDGPNQTYSPPPSNAGWNDGRAAPADGGLPQVPDGTATSATAPYALLDGGSITSGGNNANEICTPQQIAARNPILNGAPIVLPNQAAGLNIAGADSSGNTTWQGLTIEQAEQIDCQGTATSDLFGQANYLTVLWNSGSVAVEYYVPTHKVDYIGVGPGLYGGQYQGTMTVCTNPISTNPPATACAFDSTNPAPAGNITYTIYVDGQTPVDVATTDSTGATTHAAISLDWVGASNGTPASVALFDSIYRAAMATFFSGYPTEPASQTCNQTGSCIIGTFPAGAYAYFFIPALGWAMWVNPYYDPVAANAINRMDINFAQIMNFSAANPVLKLDPSGPSTLPFKTPDGDICTLTLGLSYGDFFKNCVQTSLSSEANQTENLELYSDISHDEESFFFNIAGVDLSFSALARLQPTEVVIDPPRPGGCPANPTAPGCPQNSDPAFEFNVDQSTLGLIANDWAYTVDSSGNIVAQYQTLAGAGALYDDYRLLSIQKLQADVCTTNPADPNCGVWFPQAVGDGGAPPPPSMSSLISSCVAPRDASGALTPNSWFAPTSVSGAIVSQVGAAYAGGLPGVLPLGCTGMEPLLSADITLKQDGTPNYDDPVNIGPIVTQIDPNYSLGMKMGHQSAVWCIDAMSINQIAAQSAVTLSNGTTQPLTGQQVVDFAEKGLPGLQADLGDTGAQLAALALPQYCVQNNILPQSEIQVANQLAGGNQALLPIDVQGGAGGTPSPRFFFKQYGLALIQTLEASTHLNGTFGADGMLSMPVAEWGPAALGSNMPVQENDLFFDSNGDGQFETMEYVDRRYVCPDGANDCAPPSQLGTWTCPTGTCDMSAPSSTCKPTPNYPGTVPPGGQPVCNPAEVYQPAMDITFNADVKDGIMNAYDVTRFEKRGEHALYKSIQPPGFAPAAASNVLFTNIFGSALLNSFGTQAAAAIDGQVDLAGHVIHASDYPGALAYATNGVGTPFTLSYSQAPTSPLQITQTFEGSQQAVVNYAPPAGGFQGYGGAEAWTEMVDWVPNQPLNGFDEAVFNNSMLDYFVQTASVDFTGVSTTALLDYNLVPAPTQADPNAMGMVELAAESTDYLGDVFMCYEPAASPPLLAIRMYTPTLAVLNWLNANPQSYTDCGIVVRWSPYDNFVNLIESTTYGVRLQVTQGGGLGRVVGAQVYVPGVPFEE